LSEQQANPRQALYAAYAKAFAEIDNVTKNAENPHFGSNYADLGAVLDTIRPVFAKHGLALYQAPAKLTAMPDNTLVISVVSMLIHESGESMAVETQVPIGKATAQNAVAATTYARRCAAAAIAGIAQVDDDGETAAGRGGREEKVDSAGVLAKISGAANLDELNALQEEVVATGDEDVVNAFTARRKELKKTKKGGKS
jgi:hypothetical protein